MTDAELIQLLQETAPESLTAEQVALLRNRLAESPELQRELSSRLNLESHLAALLGRCELSPDSLWQQLEPVKNQKRSWSGTLVIVALLLMLGVRAGFYFWERAALERERLVAEQRATDDDTRTEPSEMEGADSPAKATHDQSAKLNPENKTADDPDSQPAVTEPGGSTKPPVYPPLRISAVKFQRGNVTIGSVQSGKRKISFISAKKTTKADKADFFAEYDLKLSVDGLYDVRVFFVSDMKQTVGVVVNGDEETTEKVIKPKDRDKQPNLPWVSAGHFAFTKGKNVLRLERKRADFPDVEAVEVHYVSSAHVPDSPVQIVKTPSQPAPWQSVLDAPAVPKFSDVCFDSFDITKSVPNRDLLTRWFEPVAGHPAKITDEKKSTRTFGSFDGTVRLKAPLTEDTALRLSLAGFDKLQIHLFHGSRGVTLFYLEWIGNSWGAYVTERKPESPHPTLENLQLAATDEGRCRRSELRLGGPFEIRYRDGEIILSRADIVLLRAPLPGPPDSVFLQGQATFYGLSLIRTSDNPFPKPAPQVASKLPDHPAEIAWKTELDEAGRLEKMADGGIKLLADNTKTANRISAPLPKVGPCELIFQLEEATAGVGLFLSNESQPPAEYVRLCKVDNPKNLLWSLSADANFSTVPIYGSVFHRCYPLAGPATWVKLVVGGAMVRWYVSPDGEHWALASKPLARPAGALRFGLQQRSGMAGCQAVLRKVIVRELESLRGFVDPPAIAAGDFTLNMELMNRIVAAPLPLAEKLRTLQQGVQLFDVTENKQPTVTDLAQRFFDVGWNEFIQHGSRPLTSVRQALMSSSLGHEHTVLIGNPRSVRAELLQLLYQSEWPAAQNLCRQLRYFHQQDSVKLVDWAEAVIRREAPVLETDQNNALTPRASVARRSYGRGDSLARQRANWASPLVEELSKETYNTLAELQAVLGSHAYDDAAQMIASFDPNAVQGVAPITTDERLLVSLPAAIRLAIDTNPNLRTSLEQKFGALAELRVRQAIATGNSVAVELATVQFPTTAAAAEAHRWLGDRALTAGRFSQALSAYRQALATASPALKLELQHRERFTAAMLGQDAGTAATQNVQFGERLLSATEFESLVRESRGKSASGSGAASFAIAPPNVSPAPRPSSFSTHVRGKLEGSVGDSPTEEIARDLNKLFVDWPGRQLATVVEENTLFVSNRFQVVAYDLAKEGTRLWQSKPLRGKSRKAREWSLIPMRPLLAPQAVFVRQAYGDGLSIACLDKATGDLRWSVEPPKESLFASDPVWVFDKLFVFVVTKSDQQGSLLRLASLDPETGELLTQFDLLRLANIWHVRHCCEVTVVDDSLVATLSGLTVCCDLSGNVRWIRRQIVLPPEEEPEWVQQYFDRPVLHDGKILIAQPGVRSLDCVDRVTGRLIWSAVLPSVRRLLGVVQDQAIVLVDEGIEAYSLATGRRTWQHATSNISTGQLAGGEGQIAYVQLILSGDRTPKTTPRIVWLDPKTGTPTAAATLAKLEAPELRFGPLLPGNGRLWAFIGHGQHDPIREFLELVPAGNAEKP